MSFERSAFHVHGRGILSGVGLLALCAVLAAGFLVTVSRPSASPRTVPEQPLAVPGPSMALCYCPDAVAAPQAHQ